MTAPEAPHLLESSELSRAFPTSFVSIGGPLGIGLAAPLLTWIILDFGWHLAFGFLGAVGFPGT